MTMLKILVMAPFQVRQLCDFNDRLDVTLRCSVYLVIFFSMCAKHHGSMGLFRVQLVSDMALLKL